MTIRSNINLSKLKYSTLPKHRKIYKKAVEIIGSGNKIPPISEEVVNTYASKYPQLKIRTTINEDLINIRSRCDNWIVVNEGDFLTLYHEELDTRHGKFMRVHHVQDVFYDLDFLLASIISHDEFKISNIDHTMGDIYEIVHSSNKAQDSLVC